MKTFRVFNCVLTFSDDTGRPPEDVVHDALRMTNEWLDTGPWPDASIEIVGKPEDCIEVDGKASGVLVELLQDDSPENPLESVDCRLISFSARHSNFEHPDNYFDVGAPNEDTKQQLDAQEAFVLRYYEHGQCEWALAGEGSPGSDCRFDGVRVAGILFIGTDTPPEHRERFARELVKQYTAWCNGEVYGYVAKDNRGNEIDSCWGYYAAPDLKETVLWQLGMEEADVTFVGDLAWIVE